MPVSNAHLKTQVKVWDGTQFHMVDIAEAKRLEKAGEVQITTNLTSSQLKTSLEFDQAREAKKQTKAATILPKGVGGSKKPSKKPNKKTYETRQMKAE